MAIYNAYKKAMNDSDLDAYLSLLHDDFTVTFHKSGNTFSKSEWTEMDGNGNGDDGK